MSAVEIGICSVGSAGKMQPSEKSEFCSKEFLMFRVKLFS